MKEPLLVERTDQITPLTLNRTEKANALDAAIVEALLAAVDQACTDGTRLRVLSGAGNHCCAGFDFSDLETQSAGDLLGRFVRIEQVLQARWHAPLATVALVHGSSFGAGADLVCACERRIAAPASRFQMPGRRVSEPPWPGRCWLPAPYSTPRKRCIWASLIPSWHWLNGPH